jgi:hypothetical protein
MKATIIWNNLGAIECDKDNDDDPGD